MIVLTPEQKDFLVTFLNEFKTEMLSEGLTVQPVEIKNNLFILPEEVLNDSRCQKAKQALIDGGHLQKMTTREVLPSELITRNI